MTKLNLMIVGSQCVALTTPRPSLVTNTTPWNLCNRLEQAAAHEISFQGANLCDPYDQSLGDEDSIQSDLGV
jgi:hypothetical protein